jgi:SNF2 family DNA or RNA helicase
MLRKYNGAILADAVGLGKTFSALAVIKYFQIQNYTTVVLCPKKLKQNWEQYQFGADSLFEDDEFNYEVRFHTDLQNERLQHAYNKFKLD